MSEDLEEVQEDEVQQVMGRVVRNEVRGAGTGSYMDLLDGKEFGFYSKCRGKSLMIISKRGS